MIKPEQIPDEVVDGLMAAEEWSSFWSRSDAKKMIAAALAASRPVIRAQALEEAAKVAGGKAYGFPSDMLTEHGVGYERACKEIAAAIRALKERT